MQSKNLLTALPAIFILMLVFSCQKKKDFPDKPVINDARFNIETDTVLEIDFQDGDGNIGLTEDDSLPPFNEGSPYEFNFIIEFYIPKNGEWVQFEFASETGASNRITDLTPTGQNKALEATAYDDLGSFVANASLIAESPDSVRISSYLYDRDLNQSNVASVVYRY